MRFVKENSTHTEVVHSHLKTLTELSHETDDFETHETVDGGARLITRPAEGEDCLSMKDVSEKLPEDLTPNESESIISNE
jgi:hypothetical protein